MSNTDTTEPLDLLSEDFADFARSELDSDYPTEARFSVEGQEFTGQLLGFGSSYETTGVHKGHMPGTRPAPKVRCGSCRWADIAILRVTTDDNVPMYLVATMGKSVIDGEDQRVTTTWTPEAVGVLEAMIVQGRNGNPAKIPFPNAAAFRSAAEADKHIDAVLERNEDIVPNYDPQDIPLGR
jgi:hypothetical protein